VENDRLDQPSKNELAPATMDDWFYVSGESELGPFSQEHLRTLLAGGEIGPDTMVRKRSWMDWQRAAVIDVPAGTPKPWDSGLMERRYLYPADPTVAPDTRWRLSRTAIVASAIVASIVVAIVVTVVTIRARTGGNVPPAKESDKLTVPKVAATPEFSWLSPEDQKLLDWVYSQEIVPPGWKSDQPPEPQIAPTPEFSWLTPEDQELLDWLYSQEVAPPAEEPDKPSEPLPGSSDSSTSSPPDMVV